MSTAVTPINSSLVEYFGDSHNVPSMDDSKANVQSLDVKVGANVQSVGPRKLVSDALRSKLSTGKADEIAQQLIDLALDAPRPSDRISAAAEVLDRTEGKAVQSIRHAGVFMVLAPGEDVLAAAFGGSAPDESE